MPDRSHHNFQMPHWRFHYQLPGLKGLYLNASMRQFAVAMVRIFIPLYIIKITGSIHYVFLFYLILYSFSLLFDYPLGTLTKRLGPDRSVLISNILLSIYLAFLALAKKKLIFLFLAAVTNAALIPLYWLPYHLAFISLGKTERFGRTVSSFSILGQFSTALGPVIGGFIITLFGFNKLFSLSVILILVSTIPVFLDKFDKINYTPPFKEVASGLISKNYRDNLLAFWGVSFENFVYAICWSIFIFSVVSSFKILGIISSAALFVSMLALFWTGKYVDKKGPGILKLGVAGNSLNWIVRVFLSTARQIFVADVLYYLGAALLWTPFNAVMYQKAARYKPEVFLIKREMAIHSGGIIAVLVIWAIWLIKPTWFLVFGIGILGLLLTSNMIKKDSD